MLFVPGGGTEGTGEYVRCLVLAGALVARSPAARVGFLTSEEHPRFADDVFERFSVPGRVSRNIEAVNAHLKRLRPALVVFDNRGRTSQIRRASGLGARTLYIATQRQFLRRTFRLRRLRVLDEIWIVQRRFGDRAASLAAGQRLRLLLAGSPTVRHFDAIFPEPDPGRRRRLLDQLEISSGGYAVFVAGGGGYCDAQVPVAEIFLEAAARVVRRTGLPSVVVRGPLASGGSPGAPGVRVIEALPSAEMIDLLSQAKIVVCGGGGIAGQAIALRRACVAAPTGGPDQPERIEVYSREGLLLPARLEAAELAARVEQLETAPEQRRRLEERTVAVGLCNGLGPAVRRLVALAGGRVAGPGV